ncbi:Uma2 family endonuclease [Gloeobacter morelensis]|uniref:Uma2 family endonuclease n=1 Tax=Gloeobacter morelensis MG652769 TaxID=2781736 RepID=A0ABY3PNS5_9CYAN|nr:Uma2 family endonuclease [Gloeobacter morelensis]UFP95223.1 Uma2 family endonuclease [Gloeobacter morelensis MG652769]
MAVQAIEQQTPGPRLVSAGEFEKMARLGIFGHEERLELVDGAIIEMSPQGPLHAALVRLVTKILK